MKKSTIKSLVNYLNGAAVTNIDEIKVELENELAKGEEERKAKEAMYAAAKPIIMQVLDTPNNTLLTMTEIYDMVKDELPEDMGRGNVQYAICTLWKDEIKVEKGKPNVYRKA